MRSFLDSIRERKNPLSAGVRAVCALAALLLGVALGTFSKYLDNTAVNELPPVFAALDITNLLSRFAVWVLIALCLAVFSRGPGRAAVHVFAFFVGAVASYYLYSYFIAGFFPRDYAMIWIGFTLASPLLAVVCWYAGGRTPAAFPLATAILAVLFNLCFVYGWLYFAPVSGPEALAFAAGVVVLRRKTVRGTLLMLVCAAALGAALGFAFPFPLG